MNNTITFIKALAIILMVAGHACHGCKDYPVEGFVGLFHMQVFFFASGFCFKEKYLSDFKFYAVRRYKTTWIPILKWLIPLILIHNFFTTIGVYPDVATKAFTPYYSIADIFGRIGLAFTFLYCREPLLVGVWFVMQLLYASLICYGMIKCLTTKSKIIMGG